MKSPFLPSFSGAVVVAIVISTLVSTLMVNLLSRPFVSVVSERVEQIHKFFFGPGEDMTGADWAKRIIHDGDLILFFRHAERDKWDSVVLFDHFEVLDGVDGRDQSYSGAVCLSEKGREEAGIIRRAFGELDVPVSRVFSSPSCRAQETARLGFGRVDETWTSLLHTTAVPSDFHEEFGVDLRSRILSHLPAQGEGGVI